MKGFYKEKLRTNAGGYILGISLLLLSLILLVIAFQFKQTPLAIESAQTIGSTYLDITAEEKKIIVISIVGMAILLFGASIFMLRHLQRTFYKRSFNITSEGVESFYKGKSEGIVKYSEIKETLKFRTLGFGFLGDMAYKNDLDEKWLVIPTRIFKSNELIETILNNVEPKISAQDESNLAEGKDLSFEYFSPSNYKKQLRKLLSLSNHSIHSKERQEISNLIEGNLYKIKASKFGLDIDDSLVAWENIEVEVTRDKADRIPKSKQKTHEYDSNCLLKIGSKERINLQTSLIINQDSFLRILEKYAHSFLYSE